MCLPKTAFKCSKQFKLAGTGYISTASVSLGMNFNIFLVHVKGFLFSTTQSHKINIRTYVGLSHQWPFWADKTFYSRYSLIHLEQKWLDRYLEHLTHSWADFIQSFSDDQLLYNLPLHVHICTCFKHQPFWPLLCTCISMFLWLADSH